jgi:hypothetical protein
VVTSVTTNTGNRDSEPCAPHAGPAQIYMHAVSSSPLPSTHTRSLSATLYGCPFRLHVFRSVHHTPASLHTDMAFLAEQEEIREWECLMRESRLNNAGSAVAVFPPGILPNLQTLKTNSVQVLEWLPPLLPIRHLRIINLSSLTYTSTTGKRARRKGRLAVALAALGGAVDAFEPGVGRGEQRRGSAEGVRESSWDRSSAHAVPQVSRDRDIDGRRASCSLPCAFTC